MKFHALIMLLAIAAMAGAAPLHTTQGIQASGFDDNDQCSVSIADPTGNIIETHTIQNDCVDKDIAYLDLDCYIYPVNGIVTYTVFLDEKYNPGTYDVQVHCGNTTNSTTNFTATAPTITILDFNQYPQTLTTMKLTARTQTERDVTCTKCSEHEHENTCTARIWKTGDPATHDTVPGIQLNERGLFTFEHFIFFEGAYENFTLNITCDDYSTHETTFKPIFLGVIDLAVLGFSFSFQAVIFLAAFVLAAVMVIGLIFFINLLKEMIP